MFYLYKTRKTTMLMNLFAKLTGSILLYSFALHTSAQVTPNETQDGPVPEESNLPGVVDRKHVPYTVTQNYYRDYPSTTQTDTWYVYPQYSNADTTDWYVYTPSLVAGAPEYYVVHFDSSGSPQKVIYSKSGEKMTSLRGIRTKTGIPKAVMASLRKSDYKSWVVTDEQEEITRNSDKKKVYKLTVEKGKEKRMLYYQEDGKLLKDKKQ